VRIYQSRSFGQKVKKSSKREKEILDRELRKIALNISIGEEKQGDLLGVFVHKFKIKPRFSIREFSGTENRRELNRQIEAL
jgi:hypothetical protein